MLMGLCRNILFNDTSQRPEKQPHAWSPVAPAAPAGGPCGKHWNSQSTRRPLFTHL